MANTNQAETARRRRNSAGNAGGIYVEGSAVRRLAEEPVRNYPDRQRQEAVRRARAARQKTARPESYREVSRATQKNRERAMGMGKGYVVFIVAVSAAILFFCIHYLQLKAEITAGMKEVAVLESELTQLKEDNDAYYSQVTSNVDLDTIRKIAIGRLGMSYPTKEQVMTYTTEGNSYVRQYQDIPNTN